MREIHTLVTALRDGTGTADVHLTQAAVVVTGLACTRDRDLQQHLVHLAHCWAAWWLDAGKHPQHAPHTTVLVLGMLSGLVCQADAWVGGRWLDNLCCFLWRSGDQLLEPFYGTGGGKRPQGRHAQVCCKAIHTDVDDTCMHGVVDTTTRMYNTHIQHESST